MLPSTFPKSPTLVANLFDIIDLSGHVDTDEQRKEVGRKKPAEGLYNYILIRPHCP